MLLLKKLLIRDTKIIQLRAFNKMRFWLKNVIIKEQEMTIKDFKDLGEQKFDNFNMSFQNNDTFNHQKVDSLSTTKSPESLALSK